MRFPKLLRGYLYSSTVIFLIPFVTILTVYILASGIVKDTILRSNANTLQNLLNTMDNSLSDAITLTSQVASSADVRSYGTRYVAGNPTGGTAAYELKNHIYTLSRSITGSVNDLFVYYPELDMIVSSERSCLNTKLYWQTYYQDEFATLNEFRDFCDCIYNAKATLRPLSDDPADAVLACLYTQSPSYMLGSSKAYTVATVIDPLALKQQLHDAAQQSESIIMLFDESGQLLLSSQTVELPENLLDLASVGGNPSVQMNGTEYVLLSSDRSLLTCTYVSAMPARIFWQRLNTLQTASMISIALCLGLSLVVTWMLSYRNYQPIDQLLYRISERSGIKYTPDPESEVEYLNRVLNMSIDKSDLLAQRLKNVDKSLRNTFLLRAMQGTVSDIQNQEDTFRNNGLSLLSDLLIWMPPLFHDALQYLMAYLELDNTGLGGKAKMSESTIIRLRREEKRDYSLDQVIGLCVAMHLPPEVSEELIARAGYKLRRTTLHRAYRLILHCKFMETIEQVQGFLINNDLPPLRLSNESTRR